MLLFLANAYGENQENPNQTVSVSQIELVQIETNAALVFDLYAGQAATKKNHRLIINPVLSNGKNRLQLPAIIVQSKRVKINEKRHSLSGNSNKPADYTFYTSNGQSVEYSVTFPFYDWMRGANLYLNGISVGCCSATETELGMIAERVFWSEPQAKIIETPIITTSTTGDQLAQKYTFVAPMKEFENARETPQGLFDYNMPLNMGKGLTSPKQSEVENFINETREGSLSIHFRQGKRDIDRDFGNNNKNLVELVSAVRALVAAKDGKVSSIVIAGFASPEGSLAINDRLAWDRAVAVKDFLLKNSGLEAEVIHVYNGSVDWKGLKDLVYQSNLYQKHSIINIINNVPVWDSYRNIGRHGELMRLDGGEPYRYMLREFFPKLRQAAYIKIYYENENTIETNNK